MAAIAVIVADAGHRGQPRRQQNLEETEEVAGKERDDQGHHGEEQRLLELNAPADHSAEGAHGDQSRSQHQEGEENARG